MPEQGHDRGTHHLTFCVAERRRTTTSTSGCSALKSVKKTVLFDGEIPIYHLYYGNKVGDASTLLTAFPYRQAGWMGKRGTNQLQDADALVVPTDAISFWVDRFDEKGVETTRSSRASARSASASRTRAASRTELVGVDSDSRDPFASAPTG